MKWKKEPPNDEEETPRSLPAPPTACVVAIDPGRDKCGLAVVDAEQGVLHREVLPPRGVRQKVRQVAREYPIRTVILGGGTTSLPLREELEADGWYVEIVDEYGTTLRARERYFQEHPPRGLGRLLPTSFRTPPVPYDDYAAVLLAEDYWARRKGASI